MEHHRHKLGKCFRKWNEINLITDVDFRRIDLFEDEQITLTQTIQDVRDIEKVLQTLVNLNVPKLNKQ